jgi:hypothetical protein
MEKAVIKEQPLPPPTEPMETSYRKVSERFFT